MARPYSTFGGPPYLTYASGMCVSPASTSKSLPPFLSHLSRIPGNEQAEPKHRLESISEVDYEQMLKSQILGIDRTKRPRVINFGCAPIMTPGVPATPPPQPKEERWGRRHISTTPDRILDAPGTSPRPLDSRTLKKQPSKKEYHRFALINDCVLHPRIRIILPTDSLRVLLQSSVTIFTSSELRFSTPSVLHSPLRP